jgi:hypothetical protein
LSSSRRLLNGGWDDPGFGDLPENLGIEDVENHFVP